MAKTRPRRYTTKAQRRLQRRAREINRPPGVDRPGKPSAVVIKRLVMGQNYTEKCTGRQCAMLYDPAVDEDIAFCPLCGTRRQNAPDLRNALSCAPK